MQLLIARREDGACHIDSLNNARDRLALFESNDMRIHDHVTVDGAGAEAVATQLASRFSAHNVDGRKSPGRWFRIEYPKALAALAEYDLETGIRIRSAELQFGDEVMVDGIGAGVVIGFLGDRVNVRFARFKNILAGVLAPRARVVRKARA